jgi:hypothetical protein
MIQHELTLAAYSKVGEHGHLPERPQEHPSDIS